MQNSEILATVLTVVILAVITFFALRHAGNPKAGKRFWTWVHVLVGLALTVLILVPWPFVVQGHYLARVLILPVIYMLLYLHYWLQEYDSDDKE